MRRYIDPICIRQLMRIRFWRRAAWSVRFQHQQQQQKVEAGVYPKVKYLDRMAVVDIKTTGPISRLFLSHVYLLLWGELCQQEEASVQPPDFPITLSYSMNCGVKWMTWFMLNIIMEYLWYPVTGIRLHSFILNDLEVHWKSGSEMWSYKTGA